MILTVVTKRLCKNCKYLTSSMYRYYCDYPLNTQREISVITGRDVLKRYLRPPQDINADNGCLWYKRKFYKFWVKDDEPHIMCYKFKKEG